MASLMTKVKQKFILDILPVVDGVSKVGRALSGGGGISLSAASLTPVSV